MKVGVFLGGQAPESGGAYTFQATVLNAIGAHANSSNHTFTVFSGAEYVNHSSNQPNGEALNFVSLAVPTFTQRAVAALKRDFPLIKKFAPSPNYLERVLSEQRIDAVWFVDGVAVYPIDIPYIATVWDLMHLTHPWFPEVSARGRWIARELASEAFLKRATAIITGTSVGKSEIERFYGVPSDRIHLLPHPTPAFILDPSGSDDITLSRYGISGKYLLYPAQFWPHKNHVALLQVLRCLEEMNASDYSLVLVGADKGNLNFVRQRAAELNVSEKVFFLGFVAERDLVSLYRKAFALVYVSFCGPENLPPLEAFGLGCPVLAADIPGAREQLGNAAWLIDPTKPEKIAEAIVTLCADSDQRESLIRKGLQRASRWTASDYVNGVFSILDKFSPVRRSWSA